MQTMIVKSSNETKFYICENYPHAINNERFLSVSSAIAYAVLYYGLESEEAIFSNGMGFCFIKNAELKGFRILIESITSKDESKI